MGFLIILTLIILIAIIIVGILYNSYKKTKNQPTTTININNIDLINLKNDQYYIDFYNFIKKNVEIVNEDCINCLFKNLSKNYNYKDFKRFLELNKNKEDPNIDLSKNGFTIDLFKNISICVDCY